MNRLIGRHKEQAKLQASMNSERSEFVVVSVLGEASKQNRTHR